MSKKSTVQPFDRMNVDTLHAQALHSFYCCFVLSLSVCLSIVVRCYCSAVGIRPGACMMRHGELLSAVYPAAVTDTQYRLQRAYSRSYSRTALPTEPAARSAVQLAGYLLLCSSAADLPTHAAAADALDLAAFPASCSGVSLKANILPDLISRCTWY